MEKAARKTQADGCSGKNSVHGHDGLVENLITQNPAAQHGVTFLKTVLLVFSLKDFVLLFWNYMFLCKYVTVSNKQLFFFTSLFS